MLTSNFNLFTLNLSESGIGERQVFSGGRGHFGLDMTCKFSRPKTSKILVVLTEIGHPLPIPYPLLQTLIENICHCDGSRMNPIFMAH